MSAPALGKSGRVLVVDDELPLRELMSEILTSAGYVVASCANGREALAALQRETFDAIISDVSMPDMNGIALLRAVREKDFDVPVVLCTGRPSIETAAAAVEQGALQYLVKPVAFEKLLEAAARAVKLGRLARLKREALKATGFDQLIGDRAGLETAFARALSTVWMAGQPIVGASDGVLRAHEVLLRTRDQTFPNPGALLTAAERQAALPKLGRIIRGAVASLMTSNVFAADVFVNLHPLDLIDDDLLDKRAPLSGFSSRVVLEITERASLENVPDVVGRVEALRALGYRIAIDDLGAGYAGLTSFSLLRPDVVKIDMALVRGMDRDPVKQKLVTSMASLCKDMGIVVVAEGIETEGEREAAAKAGCDLLQGFLIGKPIAMI